MNTQTTHLAREGGDDLRRAWQSLANGSATAHAVDLAGSLGATEAELLDAGRGLGVTLLRPDWQALLGAVAGLGRVKTITRNPWCVHETVGTCGKPVFTRDGVLVIGEGIDLRLFCDRWTTAFAVRREAGPGPSRSLQFFDRHGRAVHKVFVLDEDERTFEAVVEALSLEDAFPAPAIERSAAPVRPRHVIDIFALLEDWAELRDTHDFGAMLARHRCGRLQAVEAAEGQFTERLALDAFATLLANAATASTPIMVFVANPGAVQIYTGPVRRVAPARGWINVLDPDFNLHLRQDTLGSVWIVRKPTSDGVVTGLELFTPEGEEIALLYGKRKPGMPERDDWRELLATVTP
jgi:putative hemin transport protein